MPVITGTEADDILVGTDDADEIYGLGGDDIIDGGLGADRLFGGAGDDRFVFRRPEWSHPVPEVGLIDGGDGTDVIDMSDVGSASLMFRRDVATGNELFFVEMGDQRFNVLNVEYVTMGNHGNIVNIFMADNFLTVFSGNGDDIISLSGNATIHCGDGNDTVYLAGPANGFPIIGNVYGGEGTDSLKVSMGFSVDLSLGTVSNGVSTYGVSNFENVYSLVDYGVDAWVKGDSGANFIEAEHSRGSAGRAFFSGGEGDDVLIGNKGDDRLFGDDGEDVLYGGDGDDYLNGGSGSDYLNGGSGNDILDGGDDADFMEGGTGDDIYYVDHIGDRVREAKNGGFDTVRTTVDFDMRGEHIERLEMLGSANLNVIGNGLNNQILGNNGNNIIDGGAGADVMRGLGGDDIYYVDHVRDRVLEAKNGGFDTVRTTVDFDMRGQYIERLEMLGSANLNVVGNSLNNQIVGNSGNNIIDGGGGADAMRGLDGDDTYYVDHVGDRVFEAANGGYDTIIASVSITSLAGVHVERVILTGSANLNAVGNSLDNVLIGNSGNNILEGMGGQDILTGGGGNDTFLFRSIADSRVDAFDRITDLSAGDIIDLSRIDADTTRAGDQAFSLVDAFTNQAGQATLTFANGVTWLNLDVDGDGVSDFLLAINGDHLNHTGWAW